jgi:predicted metal-binding membrane protein
MSLGLELAGMSGVTFLEALCRPSFGISAFDTAQAALVFAMWCAMALAMMLPTAAPMILTYAGLAETAARKGEPAASPLVLAAGYLAVWLGAAAMLAALQLLLARLSLLDPAMRSASPLFSGAVFIAAGLYQFSALKHACVTQCQHPFRFFFANWTAEPRGVFRLGAQQGLYCLGCCWAMMLLTFAVGVMNIIWMAALGALMTIEKLNTTTRFSRALGILFIVIGAALIVTAVMAHWPARAG